MQSEVNQEENLNRIITVPNLLSFFRLCLILVIIWSYIVTFLLYGTAAVHIIWFHITPMVSDLLIGLCAIMMVISVALYIIQNTRTLKEETV